MGKWRGDDVSVPDLFTTFLPCPFFPLASCSEEVFYKVILKLLGLLRFCRIVKAKAGSDCTRVEEDLACPGLIFSMWLSACGTFIWEGRLVAVAWNESFGTLNRDVNLWSSLRRCFPWWSLQTLSVDRCVQYLILMMCLILHKAQGGLPAKVVV